MKISSKQEFFRLWEANALGNRTQLWRDPVCAFLSGAPNIGFRELRPNAATWCKVPRERVFEIATEWRFLGRNFVMDDGAPDEHRTMQGEICRTFRGLEGYISVGTKLPMRPDMAAGNMKHRTGSVVCYLLDRYMDANSRDDLMDLLDLYPDATVEFSCFSIDVGNLSNRNTLFWEVRNY
jgi:hypothetical protein